MRQTHGGDNLVHNGISAQNLEAPFRDFFASALFADGRIARLGTEERARPCQAKAALAILSDVAGAGGEHGGADFRQVAVRHEYDDLALLRSRTRPQGSD